MKEKKGLLVVISAPSGGGKDSVITGLIRRLPNTAKLITTTSRPPRAEDADGVTYYFINKEKFEKKLSQGDFLEHNFYAGNYYGVEKAKLEKMLQTHNFVFAPVDVNGKYNFDKAGVPHLSIFLLPDNLETLKKRIEKRGSLNAEKIAERLKTAEKEIDKAKNFNFQVYNREGKLSEAVDEVEKIIKKYRGVDPIK